MTPATIQLQAIEDVLDERSSQDKIWGTQTHNHHKWLTILTEEVGETAEAILEHESSFLPPDQSRDYIYHELKQVAATAIAFMEQLLEEQAHEST